MSERDYAARAGLSRGAIQKAKAAGRLVLHADGSIDPEASDARRTGATDPSKQRGAAAAAPPKLKPVPNAAISAMGDTLRENGLPPPATGGATFLQAKTANEVLKSQERRLKLSRLKGELVDRARAEALVFRLARETPVVYGPPTVAILDLPQFRDSVPAHQPLIAVHAVPWPGRVAVWRSPGEDGFELVTTLGRPARVGALAADLYPDPVSRFDLGNVAIVDLAFGSLASVTDVALISVVQVPGSPGSRHGTSPTSSRPQT